MPTEKKLIKRYFSATMASSDMSITSDTLNFPKIFKI